MKRAGILTAACLAMMMNSVAICVPYQVDSHTLHLYHFDGNALDSVTTNPIHLTLDSGATATDASIPGLGQALYTYEGTASTNVNLPSAMADSAKAISNFVGADGAFTFEAIVCPAFSLGSIPNNMQIVSGEHNSARGWQFRVEAAGNLSFINLTGTIQTISAVLPSTGPHAFTANKWYHAAVAYNGQAAVEGNLKFYWTALDSGASEPALLGSFTMNADMTATVVPNFVIGNEGRDNNGRTENWEGWIDEVRISDIAREPGDMAPQVMMGQAWRPSPANRATDVLRDTAMSWSAGDSAETHDVYFGTSFDDVGAADRSNPLGVLASEGQDANAFDPGPLEFGTTYYWRVDEVEAAPDHAILTGDVWSFTVEPYSYRLTGVTATASSSNAGMGPEKTVDGSGLDDEDRHSNSEADMWFSAKDTPAPAWIRYAWDDVHKLDKMLVWNSNQLLESLLGLGAKSITIEYSEDDAEWATLGNFELTQAPGDAPCDADTVDLGRIVAKYLRLTINNNWGSLVDQFSLSEVRFYYVPTEPRQPVPASESTGVAVDSILSWRAGRKAASHQVCFGTDQQAVAEGTAPVATVANDSFDPGPLALGTTYYWKVVEINEAAVPGVWEGDVWSFSTDDSIVVEDFESYNDDMEANTAIFQTWLDGYEVDENGSVVGYGTGPFAEQTIVFGGKQSMPFAYNNTGSAAYSEAERDFDKAQDWTQYGVQTLSLCFFGNPANAGAGRLYVKINGVKILYGGAAADLTIAAWMPWAIDLASAGVNLKKVTTLAIGIDGSGSTGSLFIDEIRLYPGSGATVTPVDPGTTGLVAHYTFDGDAQDSAGGHHGTPVGSPGYAAGKIGQALNMTADGQYVTVAYADDLAMGSFTVAAWVNIADTTASRGILGTRFNSQYTFDLKVEAARVHGDIGDGAAWLNTELNIVAAQGGAIGSGVWRHIACVVDGDTGGIRMYLDGASASTTTCAGTPLFMKPDQELRIGNSYGTEFLHGLIDDVRLYNRALSDAEVANLAGRTGPIYEGL